MALWCNFICCCAECYLTLYRGVGRSQRPAPCRNHVSKLILAPLWKNFKAFRKRSKSNFLTRARQRVFVPPDAHVFFYVSTMGVSKYWLSVWPLHSLSWLSYLP